MSLNDYRDSGAEKFSSEHIQKMEGEVSKLCSMSDETFLKLTQKIDDTKNLQLRFIEAEGYLKRDLIARGIPAADLSTTDIDILKSLAGKLADLVEKRNKIS